MIYDLHCHSNCSDGALSVEDLIVQAITNQVNTLSITDHDSVLAYEQIKKLKSINKPNIERLNILPGVEFSTQWNGIGIHIVGLNIDPESNAIQTGTNLQQHARKLRAELIAQRLEKAGLKNAYKGAEKYAGFGEISRPHFASYMIEVEFCKNIEQAFKKYLGSGKMGDIKQGWADLTTVISWIKESGGVAVLAHPHKYKMTRTKLMSLIDSFKQVGGEAMEVLSGAEDKNVTANLVQICNQKKLLASMGSDFHAPSSWNRLGMHKKLPFGCKPVWDNF